MARPVPVIAAVADITVLPTASVLLDGSGSLPSSGASAITDYLWVLVTKPAGSTATLSGATTATPSLDNVDVIGNYVVFLIVTDDAGRSSFATPYAVQHMPPEDFTTFDVPLYAFDSPVAGAFCVVKAPYVSAAARLNTSLSKPAQGEFGWLAHGLWNTIDLLAEIRNEVLEIYDRPDKELLADKISPQTPAAGISVDGLNIKDTGAVTALGSNRAAIYSLDDLTVAAGKTLKVEATGDLLVDTVGATSGGDVTSTAPVYSPNFKTPLVSSDDTLSVNATTALTLNSANNAVAVEAKTSITLYAEDNDIAIVTDSGDVEVTTPQSGEVRVGSVIGSRNVYTFVPSAEVVSNTVEVDLDLSPNSPIAYPVGLAVGDVVSWDLCVRVSYVTLPTYPVTLTMYLDVNHPGDPWSEDIIVHTVNLPASLPPSGGTLIIMWRGSLVFSGEKTAQAYASVLGGTSDVPVISTAEFPVTIAGGGTVSSPMVLRPAVVCDDTDAATGVVAGSVTIKRPEAW